MKKIISMLLVLAMMLTVLAVGVATTSAAETATVTIYGLDGSTEVKEIAVGEEFTVYSTLDVSAAAADGLIGSIEGTQTYTKDKLSLVNAYGGQYGEFTDVESVFPITRSATIANAATAGVISYNASAPSKAKAFKFDNSTAKLMVTTYKVTAAGAAEVKNAMRNLALADTDYTKIVYLGQVQPGKTLAGIASFEEPVADIDHAEVTIYSRDGSKETKSFNVGDTFKVYTTLDASASAPGFSSVNGSQKFGTKVLALESAEFPVTGADTMVNDTTNGIIKYAASTPSTTNPFIFAENSQLITTTYKVIANGYADISNNLIVLAASDEDMTKVVFGGEVQPGKSINFKGSFNAPGEVVEPTQAPTEPEPTDLSVSIIGPNGQTEVKKVNVGDTFTVYTMLNAGTTVASLDGIQSFYPAYLQYVDKVEGQYNEISEPEKVFPIVGDKMTASCQNGNIKFNATTSGTGFAFNDDKAKLIVTTYKALKGGSTTITTTLKTLIADDGALTPIIYKGQVQEGKSVNLYSAFTDPGSPVVPTEEPTQAPPEPTQAPPEPTQAPPEPTQAPPEPTQEPTPQAIISIYGIDGTAEQRSFNVGETFTVYTTLDVRKAIANGMIANISASQTYTTAVLKNENAVDEYGVVTDDTMFPNLSSTVARIADGNIRYNASKPQVNNGFKFDSENSVLIVSKYTVTAAGRGEIRNSIITMSASDANMTRIITKGVIADGYTIDGTATFTEPGTGKSFLLGDVNGDGEVDITDATIIQRVVAEMDVPITHEWLMHGDIDNSGELEISDATFIQRFAAEMTVTLYPVGQYITR